MGFFIFFNLYNVVSFVVKMDFFNLYNVESFIVKMDFFFFFLVNLLVGIGINWGLIGSCSPVWILFYCLINSVEYLILQRKVVINKDSMIWTSSRNLRLMGGLVLDWALWSQ